MNILALTYTMYSQRISRCRGLEFNEQV